MLKTYILLLLASATCFSVTRDPAEEGNSLSQPSEVMLGGFDGYFTFGNQAVIELLLIGNRGLEEPYWLLTFRVECQNEDECTELETRVRTCRTLNDLRDTLRDKVVYGIKLGGQTIENGTPRHWDFYINDSTGRIDGLDNLIRIIQIFGSYSRFNTFSHFIIPIIRKLRSFGFELTPTGMPGTSVPGQE